MKYVSTKRSRNSKMWADLQHNICTPIKCTLQHNHDYNPYTIAQIQMSVGASHPYENFSESHVIKRPPPQPPPLPQQSFLMSSLAINRSQTIIQQHKANITTPAWHKHLFSLAGNKVKVTLIAI